MCIRDRYNDSIIIVDCGMAFPENDMLGIDVVSPDVTYLKDNIDKVKGMVFTHGHEDHIGALPYIRRDLNVPPGSYTHLFLRIRVIVSFKKTAIRLRRSQDLIEQRHQPFLQFRKNTIDRSRIHSFLVLVEQYFISILSGVGISLSLIHI